MQKKATTKDKRTFPEIWEAIDGQQKEALRYVICMRTGVTRQTLYRWAKGESKPKSYRDKVVVRNSLKTHAAIEVSLGDLFGYGT